MEKLTQTQKELQQKIISYTFNKSIDADLRFIRKGEYVTFLFTFQNEETSNQIFSLKREIQDKFKCWFDSGFYTQEPIIEWSLDWSLNNDETLS